MLFDEEHFLYGYLPSVYHLWWLVCPSVLPIFKAGCLFSYRRVTPYFVKHFSPCFSDAMLSSVPHVCLDAPSQSSLPDLSFSVHPFGLSSFHHRSEPSYPLRWLQWWRVSQSPVNAPWAPWPRPLLWDEGWPNHLVATDQLPFYVLNSHQWRHFQTWP